MSHPAAREGSRELASSALVSVPEVSLDPNDIKRNLSLKWEVLGNTEHRQPCGGGLSGLTLTCSKYRHELDTEHLEHI